ncbi:protein translocase subunit SecA 2, partial [Listeria innocua FSL J1-023]
MRQNYDDRKIVKQYREIARQIVRKEGLYKNMDQDELREQTNFWRE